MPEVAGHLQLTEDQQEQIHRLIEVTSQAMRKLDQQLQGKQRQQISRLHARLLSEARDEALGLLTSQQRGRWKQLTGE